MSLSKNKLNLNFVMGTAAELIKVYPIIHLAQRRGHSIKIIATGQARENFLMQYRDFGLSEELLDWLIPSEGDLSRAAKALKWFLRATVISQQQLINKFNTGEKAYAVVHGDTLSTLVGAIVGRRLGLAVVHIEAGLRSPHLLNPFPEEITRRIVSRLVSIHMAPSDEAEQNLIKSGIGGGIINTQGNTLQDAVRLVSERPASFSQPPFALANLHRFENLNSTERWKKLIEVSLAAAKRLPLIFIMHPQTRFRLNQDPESLKALMDARVELRDRLSFSEFLALLKNAEFLISDGGSNQEECSYLGKPCLLLRETTERPEGLNQSCVLSKFEPSVIESFLTDWRRYSIPVSPPATSPSELVLRTLEEKATP